jgi:hypothetical protein
MRLAKASSCQSNLQLSSLQNRREKIRNTPKYEGKSRRTRWEDRLDTIRSRSLRRRWVKEVRAWLILAGRCLSKLFTSYSHLLFWRPASGLEIRNPRKVRQEKIPKLFFVGPKKILTEKTKEAFAENAKNAISRV